MALGVGHTCAPFFHPFASARRECADAGCAPGLSRWEKVSIVSLAHGVGHDKQPFAPMWCANVTGANATPLRIVPCFGQVSENVPKPSTQER
jgi:hypothetical protein